MTHVSGLQSGMHVFTCPNGDKHLITQDPATLTAAEKGAICNGLGTYKFPGFKLSERLDGNLEVIKVS